MCPSIALRSNAGPITRHRPTASPHMLSMPRPGPLFGIDLASPSAEIDNLGPGLVAVLIFVGTSREPNPPPFAEVQGAAAQNEAARQLKIEKALERVFLNPAKICCRRGRF